MKMSTQNEKHLVTFCSRRKKFDKKIFQTCRDSNKGGVIATESYSQCNFHVNGVRATSLVGIDEVAIPAGSEKKNIFLFATTFECHHRCLQL